MGGVGLEPVKVTGVGARCEGAITRREIGRRLDGRSQVEALASADPSAVDPLFEAQRLYRRGRLGLKQGRRDEADHDVAQAAALLTILGARTMLCGS